MRARLVPGLFVLFWSTGFVGARLGAPVSDPFAILAVRFGLAALLLAGVAAAMRAPWPPDWRARGHAVVAGLLVHAVYLGGVFWSIDRGLAAGVSALIVSPAYGDEAATFDAIARAMPAVTTDRRRA